MRGFRTCKNACVKSLVGSLLQKYRYISNESVNTVQRAARGSANASLLPFIVYTFESITFYTVLQKLRYTTTCVSLCICVCFSLPLSQRGCFNLGVPFFFFRFTYYVILLPSDSLDAHGTLCTSLLHRIKSSFRRVDQANRPQVETTTAPRYIK